jgi:hypothetical protein
MGFQFARIVRHLIPTTTRVAHRSASAPTNEDSVASPVEISAAGKGNAQLKAWKIYVDGIAVWLSDPFLQAIDQSLAIATGPHRVTVKAWDVNGSTYSQTIYITVSTSSVCSAPLDRTVVICSIHVRGVPNAGVQYSVRAVAKDQRPLAAMKLYINGVARCTVDAATLAANGNVLSCERQAYGVIVAGSNTVTVRAWDALGSFSTTKNYFSSVTY